MHVAARARLVLARRPWVYWVAVAALAILAAGAVQRETSSIAEERDRWSTTRSVLVASRQLEPGEPVVADFVLLPVAAVAELALTEAPDGAVVRQRVAAGEVITELDIARRAGPAALAEFGEVVIALSDPLARNVAPGLHVQVAADGVLLARSATVTGVVDDVIFVAVASIDAPALAAAARQGIATLLYLP
jgi:hypothetical protein